MEKYHFSVQYVSLCSNVNEPRTENLLFSFKNRKCLGLVIKIAGMAHGFFVQYTYLKPEVQ